jgi:hypothetical protein
MSVQGTTTALNLIAGAGILGNVGGVALAANVALANNITLYTSTTPVSQFINILATGIGNGMVLGNAAIANLQILSSNLVPAFTDVTPAAYAATYGTTTRFTSNITTRANLIMGNGDLGKFQQTFGAADGLVTITNILIKSAKNATDANVVTGYSGADNQITGGISGVSQAFGALSYDLGRLGALIDFANLDNLGNPSALIRQMGNLTSTLPSFTSALIAGGLTTTQVENIGSLQFTEVIEKIVYQAMTQVTGSDLAQVLKFLRVTTTGIETMADLLNPYKLFPTSFQTLTAPTSNGLRGIFVNSTGSVNTNLATTLPENVLVPLQGNPVQRI